MTRSFTGKLSLAFFFLLTLACALMGARFFVSIAPWRIYEICIAVSLLFIWGKFLWIFSTCNLLLRFSLLASGFLVLGVLILNYQQLKLSNFQNNVPLLTDYISGKSSEILLKNTPEVSINIEDTSLSNLKTFRRRLFDFLNHPMNVPVLSDADSLLSFRYTFYAYEPVSLPQDLSWSETPYGDRSWNWQLHNMGYVVTLARAYEETSDQAYLRRAEDLVLDWISDNTSYVFEPPSEFSWNDHSTAFRLMNWLYFFDVWKSSPLFDRDKYETFLRASIGHAVRLADADFYTSHHNHGIDQDRSLLAFSLMYPEFVQSMRWRKLALQRLSEQVRFLVSPNGINLEHSPGYHLYSMKQLHSTKVFLDEWAIEHAVVDELDIKARMMANYVPYIVKPNGYLAQIGDTGYRNIDDDLKTVEPFFTDSPLLADIVQSIRTLRMDDVARAWPEEGYAVIRDFNNGHLDFEDSFYLFFVAGAHKGRAHRHSDDLSFILSHHGRDLLVDPGYYSYKRDAGRAYVEGVSSHNSILIDGMTYNGWDTSLDTFQTDDKFTVIRGSHRNYPGFEHVRRLLYLKPDLAFVVDEIVPDPRSSSRVTPDDEHLFEQLFHLSPDLQVEINHAGSEAVAYSREASGPVMRVIQLGDEAPVMRIAMGEEEPMQGWHSLKHGELIPAPTLISSYRGISARFFTVLDLCASPSEKVGSGRTKGDFHVSSNGDSLLITWLEEGEKIHISWNLSDDKIGYVTPDDFDSVRGGGLVSAEGQTIGKWGLN